MPRRHISQREAHDMAKRLDRAEQRLRDLLYPTESDKGHVAKMRALPVDERFRGYLEGACAVRNITIAARLTTDGIVLHLFTLEGA